MISIKFEDYFVTILPIDRIEAEYDDLLDAVSGAKDCIEDDYNTEVAIAKVVGKIVNNKTGLYSVQNISKDIQEVDGKFVIIDQKGEILDYEVNYNSLKSAINGAIALVNRVEDDEEYELTIAKIIGVVKRPKAEFIPVTERDDNEDT